MNRRAEFLRIKADPEYKKKLGLNNIEDVCNHLGIIKATYKRWNKEVESPEEEYQQFLKKTYQHAISGKNAAYARLWAELQGKLDNKGEDKGEFSPADYITIAREVIRSLKGELESGGGNCPVCGQHKTLLPPYSYPEPEQPADREVETVDISF